MALTLLESADLYFNAGDEFYQRMMMAMGRHAVEIYMEDPGTVNHAERMVWATSVLLDPIRQARIFRMPFISHPTIEAYGAAASDAQVEAAVVAVVVNMVG